MTNPFNRLARAIGAAVLTAGLLFPTGVAATDFSEDEFVIVGEILKPEITVVISRENLAKGYDLKLEESFLNRIIESVRAEPF